MTEKSCLGEHFWEQAGKHPVPLAFESGCRTPKDTRPRREEYPKENQSGIELPHSKTKISVALPSRSCLSPRRHPLPPSQRYLRKNPETVSSRRVEWCPANRHR